MISKKIMIKKNDYFLKYVKRKSRYFHNTMNNINQNLINTTYKKDNDIYKNMNRLNQSE